MGISKITCVKRTYLRPHYTHNNVRIVTSVIRPWIFSLFRNKETLTWSYMPADFFCTPASQHASWFLLHPSKPTCQYTLYKHVHMTMYVAIFIVATVLLKCNITLARHLECLLSPPTSVQTDTCTMVYNTVDNYNPFKQYSLSQHSVFLMLLNTRLTRDPITLEW